MSAAYRGADRFVTWEGCGYLLPTIVECDVEHSLANREYLFPFASVVEIPQDRLPTAMGPSLAVMAMIRSKVPHAGCSNLRWWGV